MELLIKAQAKSPTAIQIAARLSPERIQALLDEGQHLGQGIGKILLRCKAEVLNPELGALIAAQPPIHTENARESIRAPRPPAEPGPPAGLKIARARPARPDG